MGYPRVLNFGLFALKPLAHLVHGLESECIEQQSSLSDEQRARLRDAWQRFRDRADGFLGRHPNSVTVEREELNEIIDAIKRGSSAEHTIELVSKLADEPLAPKLARMGQRAKQLARRLGKGDIEVLVLAHGVRVPHGLSWLWHVLPHAINNSVDHGLPGANEPRPASGTGRLRLGAIEQSGELHIEIEDNGRGIDWEKVRAKGRALGMPVSDQQSLVDVIFAQGVSTRDAATDVSGRGVGLAALKEACVAHGARLQLQSQPGRGTLLRVVLRAAAANNNQAPKHSRSA